MADGCNLVVTCIIEDADGIARTLELLALLQEEAAQLSGDLTEQGAADG